MVTLTTTTFWWTTQRKGTENRKQCMRTSWSRSLRTTKKTWDFFGITFTLTKEGSIWHITLQDFFYRLGISRKGISKGLKNNSAEESPKRLGWDETNATPGTGKSGKHRRCRFEGQQWFPCKEAPNGCWVESFVQALQDFRPHHPRPQGPQTPRIGKGIEGYPLIPLWYLLIVLPRQENIKTLMRGLAGLIEGGGTHAPPFCY